MVCVCIYTCTIFTLILLFVCVILPILLCYFFVPDHRACADVLSFNPFRAHTAAVSMNFDPSRDSVAQTQFSRAAAARATHTRELGSKTGSAPVVL